ncbi:hypothetical protein SNEBB_004065 [Seison nebaliae]|nr:hypothetical protein SNEBB_004065 [Seison nebaliae]
MELKCLVERFTTKRNYIKEKTREYHADRWLNKLGYLTENDSNSLRNYCNSLKPEFVEQPLCKQYLLLATMVVPSVYLIIFHYKNNYYILDKLRKIITDKKDEINVFRRKLMITKLFKHNEIQLYNFPILPSEQEDELYDEIQVLPNLKYNDLTILSATDSKVLTIVSVICPTCSFGKRNLLNIAADQICNGRRYCFLDGLLLNVTQNFWIVFTSGLATIDYTKKNYFTRNYHHQKIYGIGLSNVMFEGKTIYITAAGIFEDSYCPFNGAYTQEL